MVAAVFDGSGTYAQRARAAEAAGDLVEAARLWGRAAERRNVAHCWLRIADRAPSDEARVTALRTAIDHLDEPETVGERKTAELRLAEALVERAVREGVASPREAAFVEEAARTFERHGETAKAGRGWELIGRTDDAARAYERGGHLDPLERVLDEEARRDAVLREVRERYDVYVACLASGARLAARDALRRCVAVGPASGGYREMLAEVEGRLPGRNRVVLTVDGERREIVGAGPPTRSVVLGRGDVELPLRNLDVSRRHAELRATADGWIVTDLQSRTGTTLSGLTLGAPMRLPPLARIGLGPSVLLAVETSGDRVELQVVEGLDLGRRVTVVSSPLAIGGTGRSLRFRDGHAVLAGPTPVLLNGGRTAEEVVLLAGDVVEGYGHRIEVGR